jgi:hypothetical protein
MKNYNNYSLEERRLEINILKLLSDDLTIEVMEEMIK